MNITFDRQELAAFIGQVEKWHRDRFNEVLPNVLKNFNSRMDFTFGEARIADQIRNAISRADAEFLKANPYIDWKTLL